MRTVQQNGVIGQLMKRSEADHTLFVHVLEPVLHIIVLKIVLAEKKALN